MDPIALIAVAVELLLVGGITVATQAREKRFWSRMDRVANRLQMVDILILCAIWDGVVTEEEREIVADGLRRALKGTGVSHDVEETIARWTAHFARADAEPREDALRRLAAKLTEAERTETFESVAKMVAADRVPREAPASPFRTAASPHEELLRLLGRTLGIEPATIEEAVRGTR